MLYRLAMTFAQFQLQLLSRFRMIFFIEGTKCPDCQPWS